MIRTVLILTLISLLPGLARAACPAAPVSNSSDLVIQMVAGGDGLTQMGSDANVDATEEGAVVYDAVNKTLAVCNGTSWVLLGSGGGGGGPVTLVNGVHTGTDCTGAGGAVFDTGSEEICRFDAASCPSGWTQFESWNTFDARSCSHNGGGPCPTTGCSLSFMPFGNYPSGSSCVYPRNRESGGGECNPDGSATCTAPVLQIGCY